MSRAWLRAKPAFQGLDVALEQRAFWRYKLNQALYDP